MTNVKIAPYLRNSVLFPAALASMGTVVPTAFADVLASRPTFQAYQYRVLCTVSNVGTAAVKITKPKVTAELWPYELAVTSDCGSMLAAGRTCTWSATTQTGGAHLCRVTLSDKTFVRGTMEIFDPKYPLRMVEMR